MDSLVAWQLPAGCRAGKRKRKRRSCEPVWRWSCWLGCHSSPQSSWCGHGGHAGIGGGETCWAPVGSVDLPQHWAPRISSILWHTLTACCSSEKKNKGQEVTPSHLPHFPHSVPVLLIPDTDPHECKIQRHFVRFIPWRDVRLNYAELHQFQYVNLTHRCSVGTPWDVLWSVGF